MPISFREWREKQAPVIPYVFLESEVLTKIKKPRVMDLLKAQYIPTEVKGRIATWVDTGAKEWMEMEEDPNREGYADKIREICDFANELIPLLVVDDPDLSKKGEAEFLSAIDRVKFVQDVCGFAEVLSAEFPEDEQDTAEGDEGLDIQDIPDGESVREVANGDIG